MCKQQQKDISFLDFRVHLNTLFLESGFTKGEDIIATSFTFVMVAFIEWPSQGIVHKAVVFILMI